MYSSHTLLVCLVQKSTVYFFMFLKIKKIIRKNDHKADSFTHYFVQVCISQSKQTALTFSSPSVVNVSQTDVVNLSYKSFVNSDKTNQPGCVFHSLRGNFSK